MKKKYIFVISVLAILTSFAFMTVIFLNKAKITEKNENINIDLEKLDTYFSENGDFELSNMKNIDDEYITEYLNLQAKDIEKYIGKVPILDITAKMYVVIEAKDISKVSALQENLSSFLESYKEKWSSFLLSEYDMLYEAKVNKRGKYIYLVVSENSEDLEKYIEEYSEKYN